jgi:hypothetical protein
VLNLTFRGLRVQCVLLGFETRLQLRGRAGRELPKCARWVKGESEDRRAGDIALRPDSLVRDGLCFTTGATKVA